MTLAQDLSQGFSQDVSWGRCSQGSIGGGFTSRFPHVILAGGLRYLLAVETGDICFSTHGLLHKATHNMPAGFPQREQERVPEMEATVFL